MSLECKGETRLWRTSRESVLIAVRGVGFIAAVRVSDAARGDKVASSVAAVAAMVCRSLRREQHRLLLSAGMLVARDRVRDAVASSATESHNTTKIRAEVGEGLCSENSSAPYPVSHNSRDCRKSDIFLISSVKPISITKLPLTLIIRKEPTHLKSH